MCSTIITVYFHKCVHGTQEYAKYTVPHPLKNNGMPVAIVPLLLYTDDTSGNRSKKWNKFDCWCFMLAGIPRHINAHLNNIHYISCSNKVDATEMMVSIIAELKTLGGSAKKYCRMCMVCVDVHLYGVLLYIFR